MGKGRNGLAMLLAASAIAPAGALNAAETIAYRYDALGRLIRVGHSGDVNGGLVAQYGYDPADNRTNVAVAVTAPPPPVAGGGFEAPEVGSGFLYRPTAAFTGNSGIAGNGSAWGFAAAPEGDQVAFIQNGPTAATVSLALAGLTPGASYTVSFRLSARPGYAGIPVTLAFDGTAFGTFAPATHTFVATTSGPFTATASSGTLSFTGIASADNYASGIDMVTLAAAGGQP
jgi:YD repeat-containing protein